MGGQGLAVQHMTTHSRFGGSQPGKPTHGNPTLPTRNMFEQLFCQEHSTRLIEWEMDQVEKSVADHKALRRAHPEIWEPCD